MPEPRDPWTGLDEIIPELGPPEEVGKVLLYQAALRRSKRLWETLLDLEWKGAKKCRQCGGNWRSPGMALQFGCPRCCSAGSVALCCPSCKASHVEGHEPTCKLALALIEESSGRQLSIRFREEREAPDAA